MSTREEYTNRREHEELASLIEETREETTPYDEHVLLEERVEKIERFLHAKYCEEWDSYE